MKRDRVSYIFWLVFGIFVTGESYRLTLGEFRKPDSGLFPFLIGIVIAAISFVLLLQTFFDKSAGEIKKVTKNYQSTGIFLTLLFLYAYALIFEWLGFLPATFLFIFLLLKVIENKGWVMAIGVALLASFCSYLLFEIWLQAQLPRGIWGILTT